MLLTLKAHLELRPLDCVQLLVQPDHATLPIGSLSAREEVPLVNAVDDSVTRRFASHPAEEGREHVGDMDHLVALSGWHLARPSNETRRSDAPFSRAEVRA